MKLLIFLLVLVVPSTTFATERKSFIERRFVEVTPYNPSVIGIPVNNLNQSYWYQVGQNIVSQQTQNEVANLRSEIEILKNILDAILTELEDLKKNKGTNVDNGETKPEEPVPDPVPKSDKEVLAKLIFDDIIANSCVDCHNPAAPKGALALIDNSNKLSARYKTADGWRDFNLVDWYNLADRIDPRFTSPEKLMPKGGEPLTDQQIQLVKDYIQYLKKESATNEN